MVTACRTASGPLRLSSEGTLVKVHKTTHWIVIAVVSGSLLLAAVAAWRNTGIGEGTQHAVGRWPGAIPPACCVVAAVGVIWLAWQWLCLAAGITSIAAWIEQPNENDPARSGNPLVIAFVNLLRRRFDESDGRREQLEESVRDLQIQLQLSRRREQNTEAIIHSICDAVVVVDESDRVLVANGAAADLLGFDPAQSRQKRLGDIVAADKQTFVDLIAHCRRSKARATRQELEFAHEDGLHTYDSIVSCVHDERDRICGVVTVLHDVTREKEISRAKNDFVSHVSHELKTPLASITAYAEMLVDGEADDETTRRQFYEIIQTQAQRLNRLIEDILNISRIESGLIKVAKEPVSLTILIEEQLGMIRSFAREKDIEVSASTPIVFDQVNADKDMLQQVIVNLLSNAVKYTQPGGSVTIASEVDAAAGTVTVTITDTGVGIPAEDLPHVFDKFFRVGANKNVAKGTGLGLNLVKQIIEKVHDGRVFVTSEPGVGSTFGFELPLAAGIPAAAR